MSITLARLQIFRENTQIGEYVINADEPPMTIGRHPDSTLSFNDTKMSGRHCILEKRDNYFYIVDQNSTNGTYVNGSRIRVRRLYHGDVIRCGFTELKFEWLANEPNEPEELSVKEEKTEDKQISYQPRESLDIEEGDEIRRIGDYIVLQKVGQGGIGEVFKAEHITSPGIQVAIKILTPAAQQNKILVERFVREARACIALEHPRLIKVFEVDMYRGRPYFVMEYVQGNPLDKYIKKNGALSVLNSLKIAGHIIHALAYVHSYNIIHRDLKPGNILMEERTYNVKLIDLGLAKMLDQSQLTLHHHIVGTPRYMAPEQMKNPDSIDNRADIYALGATLYQMVTGVAPYAEIISTDRAALLRYMYNNLPVPVYELADVPMEVSDLVNKAMAKRREDRFANAKEMYIAIYNLIKKFTAKPVSPK